MAKLWIFVLVILAAGIFVLGHDHGDDVYDAVDEIIKDFADEPAEEKTKGENVNE